MDNDRQELRQVMIQRRLALSPAEYAARSAALCAHLAEHFSDWHRWPVGFCWPIKNEPDLRPWMEALTRQGGQALLPVVLDDPVPLRFRVWHPGEVLAVDGHGIPFPATGPFVQPQALLVPLVAFDSHGFRLGYGGGFFDRTLACWHPPPLTIGYGFDFQRVASVSPEAHDIPMHGIVTEQGYFDGQTRR